MKRILIIDDETAITKMLQDYLTLENYDVDTLNDPTQAMPLIERNSYTVVICDIAMPQLSGLELIEKIKKYDSLIQVIMITGYVTMGNILTAFRLGASNIFMKPLDNLDVIGEEVALACNKLHRILTIIKDMQSGLRAGA